MRHFHALPTTACICFRTRRVFQVMKLSAELPEGRYSQSTLESLAMYDESEVPLDVIVDLVQHIHITQGDGAILIFLSGWEEISAVSVSMLLLLLPLPSASCAHGHFHVLGLDEEVQSTVMVAAPPIVRIEMLQLDRVGENLGLRWCRCGSDPPTPSISIRRSLWKVGTQVAQRNGWVYTEVCNIVCPLSHPKMTRKVYERTPRSALQRSRDVSSEFERGE